MTEKVKKFWEKNKAAIVIGATSIVAGGVFAVVLNRKIYGEVIPFAEMLRSYDYKSVTGNTIVGDIILAQDNADHVEIFKYMNGDGGTLAQLICDVKAGINGGIFDPDVNVVGCVVFTKERGI